MRFKNFYKNCDNFDDVRLRLAGALIGCFRFCFSKAKAIVAYLQNSRRQKKKKKPFHSFVVFVFALFTQMRYCARTMNKWRISQVLLNETMA